QECETDCFVNLRTGDGRRLPATQTGPSRDTVLSEVTPGRHRDQPLAEPPPHDTTRSGSAEYSWQLPPHRCDQSAHDASHLVPVRILWRNVPKIRPDRLT